VTAQRLEGKPVVQALRAEIQAQAAELRATYGIPPTLAVVLVEGDAASERYVRTIRKTCGDLGIEFRLERLANDSDQATVNASVAALSADTSVHGIIIQMPLPKHLSADQVVQALDYRKDVDGVHPSNAGLLAQGTPNLVPNTPAGGMELLRYYGISVAGKRAAVVGRSNIVGKPMAALLTLADATVTICHSRTKDLGAVLRECKIVAVAAGRAGLVTGDMLAPGAVVIDFGFNVTDEGATVGDVNYESALEVASAITPVPGGTGPLTNVMLMRNVLTAYRKLV
jgi:methylenetetrahydrofolate dehydrogenase (NADP+)/methenyltetrahydrofolate cyclohydrolase